MKKREPERTPDPYRVSAAKDALERFSPTNQLVAHANQVGRASPTQRRQAERDLSRALEAAISPAELTALIEQAVTWALEYRSPRLLMQIIQLRLAYGLGTPVQRSISATGKLEDLLNRVDSLTEAEFTIVEQQIRNK